MKAFFAVFVSVLWAAAGGDLVPPKPPERPKAKIETASELALDLSRALAFLEQGQVYYKAFSRGSHSIEANRAFVRFLQDYERELETARKELALLQKWVEQNSELKRAER